MLDAKGEKRMKRLREAALTVLALCFATPALSVDKGDWILRGGAVAVIPDEDSGRVSGVPGSEVGLDSNVQLGATLVYMMTDRVGIELLVATPFSHDIESKGSLAALGNVGDFKHLPPTLSVQYYFNHEQDLRPYLGVGLNYTFFFDEESSDALDLALGGPTDIKADDSPGVAVQAGLDWELDNSWFVNLAVWYIKLDTEVTLNTQGTVRRVDVDIDPFAVLAGVGRRF